jgi:hypothetical protein
MILLDTLLVGSVRFVLNKLLQAAEKELNDEDGLREQLLAAQMRVELGEMTQEEFQALEEEVLARLRDIAREKRGDSGSISFGAGDDLSSQEGGLRIVGAEASFGGDDVGLQALPEPAAAPEPPPPAPAKKGRSSQGRSKPRRRGAR